MTSRTPQCEVFFPLLSSSEHSGVPEDSKSPLFQVLGFTPTLDQVRVATFRLGVIAIVTTTESYDVLVGGAVLYPMGFQMDYWMEITAY
jgi:hypothetical protein